jgi:cell division septal protein FtsQ
MAEEGGGGQPRWGAGFPSETRERQQRRAWAAHLLLLLLALLLVLLVLLRLWFQLWIRLRQQCLI